MEIKDFKKTYQFKIDLSESDNRVISIIGTSERRDSYKDVVTFDGWDFSEYNGAVLFAHNNYSFTVGKTMKIIPNPVEKNYVFKIKFPTLEEMSSSGEYIGDEAKFIDFLFNMYKNKYMNSASVGFQCDNYENIDDGGQRLIKKKLKEISLCAVGANPDCVQQLDDFTVENYYFKILGGVNQMIDKTKAGAKHSKETLQMLAAIKTDMENCHKCHKEAMSHHKSAMEKMDAFSSDGVEEPEGGGSGDSKPKKIDTNEFVKKYLGGK